MSNVFEEECAVGDPALGIKYLKCRSSEDGPRLLIIAGVHGDEYEPIRAASKLRKAIPRNLTAGEVNLVTVANPGAFGRGNMVAEDGLNMARIFPGRSAGSETERRAFALSGLIRSCDYLVDMHTGGTFYRVLPFAGYILHQDPKILEIQRQMALAFRLGFVWGAAPDLEGRTLSVARDMGIPAIYTEWVGGGACSSRGVHQLTKGCLNLMGFLKMGRKAFDPDHAQPVYEDFRSGKGAMEKQNAARADGFYVARCRIGQTVTKGELIAEIYDERDVLVDEAHAHDEGVVVMLRAHGRINTGDSSYILACRCPGGGTLKTT